MNAKNKHCIGIDLGTSFSLISIYRDNEASVIPNALGSYLTPSVVGIDDDGSILVGTSAQERLITHPDMTASQFKRVMGTNKEITLANKRFRPEELSAFVLKVLKNDAETFIGDHVSEAIISVPAYFNDAQRKATKAAAQLAGLDVERLINEPTAAAIAYGLPRLNKDMTFVVLDLGGGTFDVTVLEIFENTIEVHASAGDTFLGGNDFTAMIADHMKTVIGMTDTDLSMYEKNILWKKAEEVKKALSGKEQVSTELCIQNKRFPWELSRHEFDTFTRPLIDRMRPPVERALSDAHVNPSDLSAIVLVGGATRMPIVRDLVSRMFGREPYTNIDPDKVIAMGAAIQSAFKSRSGDLKEVVMTDVCPYTLGVEVVRQVAYNDYIPGHFLPIIERNSTIPISRVETLQTVRDNQTTIEINIFQGESRLIQNNSFLGKLALVVPKDKAGNQNIDVRFTYDINGLLEVEAFAHGTGETKRIIIEENPGILSKNEIEERLKKIQHLKIHPREQTQNRAVIARGERLYQELLGEERKAVADILAFLDAAIASQDTKTIENARNKAISLLDEIESGRTLF